MYSTCIHCQKDLGRNDLLETLPVGRRIAFDEATGRLWVICAGCARWNLVPFESRWESIEAGEKLYRASVQRMSTGEIGLARTREGTELVRIGAPLRPEMAAWRYGASLIRRRVKYATGTGPLLSLFAGAAAIGYPWFQLTGLGLGTALVASQVMAAVSRRYIQSKTQAVFAHPDGAVRIMRTTVPWLIAAPGSGHGLQVRLPIFAGPDVKDTSFFHVPLEALRGIRREGFKGWANNPARVSDLVPSHYALLDGDDAVAALRVVLPLVHESGASRRMVADASAHLDATHGSATAVLFTGLREWERTNVRLDTLGKPRRLALEMFVHEDSERRWLAGELLDLEQEWRKANEIATIADSLVRDARVEARMRELQGAAATQLGIGAD